MAAVSQMTSKIKKDSSGQMSWEVLRFILFALTLVIVIGGVGILVFGKGGDLWRSMKGVLRG